MQTDHTNLLLSKKGVGKIDILKLQKFPGNTLEHHKHALFSESRKSIR